MKIEKSDLFRYEIKLEFNQQLFPLTKFINICIRRRIRIKWELHQKIPYALYIQWHLKYIPFWTAILQIG